MTMDKDYPKIDDFNADYRFQLVSPDKQGRITVQGAIIPFTGGGGGGGGTPPRTPFKIDHFMKAVKIFFTKPANTNQIFVCSGSTNEFKTKVTLANGSPSSGITSFSLNPGTLGQFTVTNATMADTGVATTKLIATTNDIPAGGLTGKLIATASNLVDKASGVTLPKDFSVSTNITVIIPKLKIEFEKMKAEPEVFNYVTNNAYVTGNTNLELRSNIKISTTPLAPNLDLGKLSSTRTNLDTFVPAKVKTDATKGIANTILKTKAKQPELKVIVCSQQSDPHQMLPAYYLPRFRCTAYYTPIESGFTNAAAGFVTNLVTKTGLQGHYYPMTFLQAVEMEGIGRITIPVNDNNYIYSNGPKKWGFLKNHVGNLPTRTLVGRSSCAVAYTHATKTKTYHRTIPDAKNTAPTSIRIISSGINSAIGSDFLVMDVGGKVDDYQIDLFWGEDNPLNATEDGITIPAGLPNPPEENNAEVIINSY